jgi:hypothetical protein
MPQKRGLISSGSASESFRDRQAGSVGGDDRVRRDERRDLLVEVELPVHPLGDRLDHEVAFAQQGHVLLVVGLHDQRCILGHAQRRRLELLEVVDRLGHNPFLGPSFAGSRTARPAP